MPYESFIGIRLGSFRLNSLIRAGSCYDLYAVEPLFETSQTYEARAYLFRSLKSDEQKYPRRNFKRCQRNVSNLWSKEGRSGLSPDV